MKNIIFILVSIFQEVTVRINIQYSQLLLLISSTRVFILFLIAGITITGNVVMGQPIKIPVFKVENTLKGQHLVFASKFHPTTPDIDIMVDNGVLIYKNNKEPLRFLDIKNKKCILSLECGDYPAQFYSPYIASSENDSLYCYISDDGIVSKIYNDKKIIKTPQRVYSSEYEFGGNLVSLVHDFEKLNDSTWIFAGKSNNGFSIFTTENHKKKAETKEIIPLNLYKDKKDWQPYLGTMTISPDKKTIVYAYNFYPVIQFIDIATKKIKTIKYPGIEYNYQTINEGDGLSLNVFHYQYCYAGDRHVYFLHIERTPEQFYKDNQNKNTFVYIEQYDWEGNSIQKMKLDKFGYYFCVDEATNKLYLASMPTKNESPFYEYEIPIIK